MAEGVIREGVPTHNTAAHQRPNNSHGQVMVHKPNSPPLPLLLLLPLPLPLPMIRMLSMGVTRITVLCITPPSCSNSKQVVPPLAPQGLQAPRLSSVSLSPHARICASSFIPSLWFAQLLPLTRCEVEGLVRARLYCVSGKRKRKEKRRKKGFLCDGDDGDGDGDGDER